LSSVLGDVPDSTLFPYTTLFRSPELVVGTGNAGAVYVFGWAGHRWTLLGQTPYMWSPVRALHGADLDGDGRDELVVLAGSGELVDRKSTRLNSSHVKISYAVFCL